MSAGASSRVGGGGTGVLIQKSEDSASEPMPACDPGRGEAVAGEQLAASLVSPDATVEIMSPLEIVEIDIEENDLVELDRLAARFGGDRSTFLREAVRVMSERDMAEEGA